MALAKDPEWLALNSVTGLEFGNEVRPRIPRQWPPGAGDAEGVIAALVYQLHERLAFVPAPDPIVASLIADLGCLFLLYRSAEFALPVFELALLYRPAGEPQVAARRILAEELAHGQSLDGRVKWGLGILVLLALAGGLFLKWRPAR